MRFGINGMKASQIRAASHRTSTATSISSTISAHNINIIVTNSTSLAVQPPDPTAAASKD
jgi:hypothetical protein